MSKDAVRRWVHRLRSRGLAVQLGVLMAAVLAAYAAVAPVAASLSGRAGPAAAAVAAGLCLAGAALALVVGSRLGGAEAALRRVLIGMILRMGVPLAGGLAIQLQGGRLARAGVLVYLAVFYPVTLFVETVLAVPSAERFQGHPEAAEQKRLESAE